MTRFVTRRALLLLHRWLGLTAGVIFAIAAGTGAVLVYADELDALIGGPRFQTTPGMISPDAIDAAIRRHVPDGRLVRVVWPSGPVNVLGVRVTDGARQRDLVLDAGSGALLQPRPQHVLLVALRRLHVGLLMGTVGARLVLLASCASIVSLALGLALWWPGLRRMARGIRLRFRRGAYVLNLDMHQILGVVALPLLFVMTVTGVLMNAAALGAVSQVLHGADAASAWAAVRSSPAGPDAGDIDLPAATRHAQAGAEGASFTHVSFPTRPDGIVEVRMLPARADGPRAWRVALDRHNGAVLLRQELLYDGPTNGRLHFGLLGGPIVRALYAVSCLVGFSLLPTGVALWWMKRRRLESVQRAA